MLLLILIIFILFFLGLGLYCAHKERRDARIRMQNIQYVMRLEAMEASQAILSAYMRAKRR